MTVEEFIEQCKEGCSRQRELLLELMASRITPGHSSEEKLEIIRTCIAARYEYYRGPDCSGDDFTAYYQLSQLVIYSKSWAELMQRLCFEE